MYSGRVTFKLTVSLVSFLPCLILKAGAHLDSSSSFADISLLISIAHLGYEVSIVAYYGPSRVCSYFCGASKDPWYTCNFII